MGKGEVSWKSRTEEGVKRELYAHRTGREWKFYIREKRFDEWQRLPNPPLADWLELLDGVQRRIARRLVRPEEEERLKKTIAELFPDAKLEP